MINLLHDRIFYIHRLIVSFTYCYSRFAEIYRLDTNHESNFARKVPAGWMWHKRNYIDVLYMARGGKIYIEGQLCDALSRKNG